MSSRLFQEVREKRGLVYSIYSSGMPTKDFGIFYIYAGVAKKNLVQVVEIILHELSKIKKEGLTKAEISRAKEYIKGTMVLGLESTSARMSYLARTQSYHERVITIEEIFEKIDRATNDDIIRLANEHFLNKYLTLTIIGNLLLPPVKSLVI